MENHIQEYFTQKETQAGNELFRVDSTNVDIKTQVSEEELRLVTILMMNDDFLKSKGIPPIFDKYYTRFLRLKVSLDRQGRKEYVDINKRDNSDDTIKKLGALDTLRLPKA